MLLVRPRVLRPMLQRGGVAMRAVPVAALRGARVVLGQLGESGPAATAVSLMLAAGLGVLALRTFSFSEEAPVLHSPPPAVAERTLRATVSRPANPPAWRNPAPEPPRAFLLVGTPEHADRLRAAISEANAMRDSLHLEPLEYEVVLVTTPEEELALRQEVVERNHAGEALGAPPIMIIDMRGGAEICEPDREENC